MKIGLFILYVLNKKTGSVFSEKQWFQINGKANMYQRETQIPRVPVCTK